MNRNEHLLLRRYIRDILKEETGYGMSDSFAGGVGGTASHGAMYTAFIKPFVDVIHTAKGKLKELGTHVVAGVKVAFTAAATTFLPFLASDYNSIFKHQQAQINKVKSEYAAVYKSTWDAFKSADIAITGFFCYPGYVLSGLLAKKSPEIALGVANTLTGGELDGVLDRMAGKLDKKFDSVINQAKSITNGKGSHGFFESRLYEKKHKHKIRIKDKHGEKDKREKDSYDLSDLVTHPEFVKEVISSQTAQELQKKSLKIHMDTMNSILNRAKEVASIRDVASLRRTLESLKKDVKESAGEDPIKALQQLEKMPAEERRPAEQQLIQSFKASSKKMTIDKLEKKIAEAKGAGYEGKLISDYEQLIGKIKAL